MRSQPRSLQTDPRGIRYRTSAAPSANTFRTPPSVHRPISGRIHRSRSPPALALSERKQQQLWEAVTGSPWEPEHIEQRLEESQSLQYIAPSSLASSRPQSAASTATVVDVESTSMGIDPKLTITQPTTSQDLFSSMEYLLPAGHSQFGSNPSSYQSNLMANYYGNERARVSLPYPTLAPAYTTATSTTNQPSTSPALSTRGTPIKQEDMATAYPYRPSSRASYVSPAQTSSYPYTQAQHPTTYAPSYSSPYSTAQHPYTNTQYSESYPQSTSAYQQPPPSAYDPIGYGSSGYSTQPVSREPSVAISTARARSKESHECWDHGCNGKTFSTESNYLRHTREKNGTAAKAECEKCGALFTRTTARNGHVRDNKCKRKGHRNTTESS